MTAADSDEQQATAIKSDDSAQPGRTRSSQVAIQEPKATRGCRYTIARLKNSGWRPLAKPNPARLEATTTNHVLFLFAAQPDKNTKPEQQDRVPRREYVDHASPGQARKL